MKRISWKTTGVALLGIIVLIASFSLVYLEKVNITDMAGALSPIALFITSIGLYFAKDKDKSGLTL